MCHPVQICYLITAFHITGASRRPGHRQVLHELHRLPGKNSGRPLCGNLPELVSPEARLPLMQSARDRGTHHDGPDYTRHFAFRICHTLNSNYSVCLHCWLRQRGRPPPGLPPTVQGCNSIDIFLVPESAPKPVPTHIWSFVPCLNLK